MNFSESWLTLSGMRQSATAGRGFTLPISVAAAAAAVAAEAAAPAAAAEERHAAAARAEDRAADQVDRAEAAVEPQRMQQ
jgi:hypothetical protein